MATALSFPPPPTYTVPIAQREADKAWEFSPVWLHWYLEVGRIIADSGLIDASVYATLEGGNTFTGAQGITPVTLTSASGTIDTDATLSNNFEVVLTENALLASPTGLIDGGVYRWMIRQDGVGGWTLAFGAVFAFPSGVPPTVSAGASQADWLVGQYFASTGRILATLSQAFA